MGPISQGQRLSRFPSPCPLPEGEGDAVRDRGAPSHNSLLHITLQHLPRTAPGEKSPLTSSPFSGILPLEPPSISPACGTGSFLLGRARACLCTFLMDDLQQYCLDLARRAKAAAADLATVSGGQKQQWLHCAARLLGSAPWPWRRRIISTWQPPPATDWPTPKSTACDSLPRASPRWPRRWSRLPRRRSRSAR